MKLARVVEYTDIFPEEEGHEPDIVELVSGINRKSLVTLTANMMARLSGKKSIDRMLEQLKAKAGVEIE